LRQDLIAVRSVANSELGIAGRGPARSAIPSASDRAARSGSIRRISSVAIPAFSREPIPRSASAWSARFA
jgi:hypothetical protein